ncbi:unnamed protein product [Ceutorhynchus assimilis]|uniref:Protein quiver n=1 Tax=Ceutorhynchus assimilis TaxID=467358 RepID=A0A9N9QP33_9CUCU|nr:unnamed protein product [Ceutorhynchus assimilis]
MVYLQGYCLVVLGVILGVIESGLSLRCWKCTSQLDATCRDYFNTTRILLNQRHMDQYSYGNLQQARTDPHLSDCDGMHTSTYGQVKNVCLKWVIQEPDQLPQVHRECQMVPRELQVGACPEKLSQNRPRYLQSCSTWEYDGCNSASTNGVILLGLVPAVVLLLGK